MDELKAHVKALIEKAANTQDSVMALQFSQAACNAANAMAQLQQMERPPKG